MVNIEMIQKFKLQSLLSYYVCYATLVLLMYMIKVKRKRYSIYFLTKKVRTYDFGIRRKDNDRY